MNTYTIDLISGSISGMIGLIAGHPFDTVKCRMQISPEYKRITTAFKKIIKEEKIKGLYKGILPPLFSQLPLHAL